MTREHDRHKTAQLHTRHKTTSAPMIVPCRPRPRHMFYNCPVRRSCNKLGALILRKYGKLPVEAREIQRVRVVMVLDFDLSSGVACALIMSVIRCLRSLLHDHRRCVCRSRAGCFGLLRLQCGLVPVRRKGGKAMSWCIIIAAQPVKCLNLAMSLRLQCSLLQY